MIAGVQPPESHGRSRAMRREIGGVVEYRGPDTFIYLVQGRPFGMTSTPQKAKEFA
jgi:hypothetical protein